MTDRLTNLRNNITVFFQKNGYQMITDLSTITAKVNILEYTCACKEVKRKSFKDMENSDCRKCMSLAHTKIPTDFSVLDIIKKTDKPGEEWRSIVGGFISNKGRASNPIGKLLTPDERGRYYFNGSLQYASIIMAKAFELENNNLLNGISSNHVVRNLDKNNLVPTIDKVQIVSRTDIAKENGAKSHKSEEFKEAINKDVFEHIKKFKYEQIEEFPNHFFFEDGNIYNRQKGPGGSRFITGSKSNDNKYKTYKLMCTNDGSYYIHILICMAFHPIEGKCKYEDYKDLEVNHIDGNTENNNASNLEWSTREEQMQHAYDTGLNKKIRAVIQFENNNGIKGNQIAEFESLAKASRETKIPEHEIREICKLKTPLDNKRYIWEYKNKEETEEYRLKFSSKLKTPEQQIKKSNNGLPKPVIKFEKNEDGTKGKQIEKYTSLKEAYEKK